MEHKKLLVGTSKGLITYEIHKDKIVELEVNFEGLDVSAIHQHFDGRVLVSISHKHWGEKLFSRETGRKVWKELNVPKFDADQVTVSGKKASLKQIWSIHHGGESHSDRIWIGTEPGALFKSEDGGMTYELVKALWNHPSRLTKKQWFGAGKDLPFVHSITLNPKDADQMYISVSCAGIFKSDDGGEKWNVVNRGMKATYLPHPTPEAGYDPHLMLMHQKENNILWQQNHCGIFRSMNGGDFWNDVSGEKGFPGYGFAIAIDEENIDEAWVIPVADETNRVPTSLELRVLTTKDGGQSWVNSSQGLPSEKFFGIVLRNGFVKSGDCLVFGTTNGNIYFSHNRGESWIKGTSNLAKVSYLSFCN